jgi:hypothetical protein
MAAPQVTARDDAPTRLTRAESFLGELRKGLPKQKPGTFLVRTVMDPSGGEFKGYASDKDSIAFKLPMGDTSMNLTELAPEELVRIGRKCAGGEYSPEAALRAACFLLAKGKSAGVKELVDLAKRGGQPMFDMENRLAIIERGAREV